jgi:hypothetical protein
LKSECNRPNIPVSPGDARGLVLAYVKKYNDARLHSAIAYITPRDLDSHENGPYSSGLRQRLGASGRGRIQHEGANCQFPERSCQLRSLRSPAPRAPSDIANASGRSMAVPRAKRSSWSCSNEGKRRSAQLHVVALVEPEEVGEEHHDVLGAAREDLGEHRVDEQPRVSKTMAVRAVSGRRSARLRCSAHSARSLEVIACTTAQIEGASWVPSITQSAGRVFSARYTSPGSSSSAFCTIRKRPIPIRSSTNPSGRGMVLSTSQAMASIPRPWRRAVSPSRSRATGVTVDLLGIEPDHPVVGVPWEATVDLGGARHGVLGERRMIGQVGRLVETGAAPDGLPGIGDVGAVHPGAYERMRVIDPNTVGLMQCFLEPKRQEAEGRSR